MLMLIHPLLRVPTGGVPAHLVATGALDHNGATFITPGLGLARTPHTDIVPALTMD